MDLRQIRCFVAVAEELHFRRAAERIGLAQAALSAQVRALEEELGFALLFRTTRHVSLTQAGAVFLDEMRAVLDRLDAGLAAARAASSEGLARLRLGGIDAALIWFLPPVIEAFRRSYPEVRLPLTEVSSSQQQVQDLQRHQIDLAFFRPPIIVDGISWEALFEERVFAAVPARSPLARRSELSVEDLAQEKIITYARHARPLLAEMVARSFEAAGLRPDIQLEVRDKSTLLGLVAQGAGVGLVPQWITESAVSGVAFRPYSSASGPLQFGVGWRTSDHGETLDAFLDLSRAQGRRIQCRFAASATEGSAETQRAKKGSQAFST